MGVRYSKVDKKFKREIVLLKSFPCVYGKCAFCNYIEDNSINEAEMNRINFEALEEISGEYGALEVINSGSVFELPKKTLEKIKELVVEKNIKILYFEIYISYLNRLDEIRNFFNIQGLELRFRTGLETFDDAFRNEVYKKPFKLTDKILEKMHRELFSACLLICTKGQTKDMIKKDIKLGLKYFKALTLNVFVDNGTEVKSDKDLVRWLVTDMSHLFDDDRIELLIDNKDLGVFEQ